LARSRPRSRFRSSRPRSRPKDKRSKPRTRQRPRTKCQDQDQVQDHSFKIKIEIKTYKKHHQSVSLSNLCIFSLMQKILNKPLSQSNKLSRATLSQQLHLMYTRSESVRPHCEHSAASQKGQISDWHGFHQCSPSWPETDNIYKYLFYASLP
jgi:hypothetical protein